MAWTSKGQNCVHGYEPTCTEVVAAPRGEGTNPNQATRKPNPNPKKQPTRKGTGPAKYGGAHAKRLRTARAFSSCSATPEDWIRRSVSTAALCPVRTTHATASSFHVFMVVRAQPANFRRHQRKGISQQPYSQQPHRRTCLHSQGWTQRLFRLSYQDRIYESHLSVQ